MTRERLQELLTEADNERLSYGEIAEIDTEAEKLGIENLDEMMVIDVLLEIERLTKGNTMKRIKITNKAEARDYAIQWQMWQADQALSLGELTLWQNYFEALGRKYGLLTEFKENAII